MIHVIASVRIKIGMVPGFLEIFKANMIEVRKEPGCIQYLPAVDINLGLPPQALDENIVTIVEKWESVEALRVHLESARMQAYREKVGKMVEGVSLKILQEA